MTKLLGVIVLGLLWCSTSYANIIMQDLINALVETKKPKSIEVANNLKSTGDNDKSYDLVIRKGAHQTHFIPQSLPYPGQSPLTT